MFSYMLAKAQGPNVNNGLDTSTSQTMAEILAGKE
jgi:hypothetical protein